MAEAVHPLIDIEVRSKGVEAVQKSLDQLVNSEEELIKATERVVKIRERNESAVERLARKYDLEYRAMRQIEQAQKELDRAKAAGLAGTQAYERAIAGIQKAHIASSSAMNDNATAIGLNRMQMLESIHVAKSFVDQIIAGQSPLRAFAVEGGRVAQIFSSGTGGAGATAAAFGNIALRALISPVGAAATLAAGVFGVKVAGDAAAESMAKLAEEARQTGLTPNRVTGAKIVGARAGLDDKQTVSAFAHAQNEFEAYSRNSGALKDILEKIDKGFLKVLDSARGSSEWIDKVDQEIRKLPTAQAQELAKALYSPEGGSKLFEEIRNGSVSMAGLSREAEKAGANFDASAIYAERMKREIAEADQIASTKLAATFGRLSDFSLNIDLAWARIKARIAGMGGEIGDLWQKTQQMGAVADARRTLSPMMQEEPPEAAAMRQLGLFPQSAAKASTPTFATSSTFYQDKAKYFPQLESPTVGETRNLFETKDRKGASATERTAATYAKITRELDDQLRLASSTGAEHDKIALAIKIENEQLKLGKDATQAQRDHVAEMVTKIDAATEAQQKLNEQSKGFSEAYSSISNTLAGGIKDVLLKGAKPKDVLQKSLEGVQNNMFDAILTGSGPFAEAFGLKGKDGGVGGAFGGIADLFGFNSGGLDKMTIQAREVQLSQTGGGSGGGVSGFLGNLLGTTLKSLGGGFGGGPGTMAPFAEGGVMTSMGALPLRRYSGGGIADSPQLALFGEGRRPEAYVPLPDGRRIPAVVDMRGLGDDRGAFNAAQQRNVAAALAAARGSGNDNRGTLAAPKTEVHIHGAPQGTKVTESVDSKGNRRIDAVIDERWAASAGSPQGREALRSAFVMPRR